MSKKTRDIELFIVDAPKYFRKIENFRNVIVHEYFGVDEEEVWDVVTNKLMLLNADASKTNLR